ncbi:FAD-dependent oxidoreductase [Duganella sp. BJB488]|uniref:hydroxysqualene dehydroxylase HpnE n=1 Tax=unclassified Duganella TaxID=2636909 RepID=UPI000E35399E|nr:MULTISPECIES: hydroxysqualene dehydroxylase HpnE [unclassified Duganella]RFP21954.1 FAD-dependent oxidoreductase [Duganella sp. BJB489]RFP23747.1 FAD-dependent oxidoreductase [Duganella sp. BJB488]RFP38914.1 FAD-dependent oxidoreductase [Duganella sp. BJB480]
MANEGVDQRTGKVEPGLTSRAVAVIGGGWAGCAAAVELARAGYKVTQLEAARTLGGRARRIETDHRHLDNGQHILLGAYSETLRLMKLTGVDREQALLSLPLQMRYPAGSGGMDFVAPRLPAPLHLALALLRAKGLDRADKLSLARFSTTARWMGWALHTDCSVSELLERFDQTPRLIQLMWRPLCLAALNTPPERASAQVFLNVLRDSLGAKRSASDMLLPRADLSALLPEAAAAYVEAHGGSVRTGAKVQALRSIEGRLWQLDISGAAVGGNWSTYFSGVVLATGASQAATLLHGIPDCDTSALCSQLTAFEPEAITTCYLQYDAATRLDLPFFALLDDPDNHQWGQFVFDRGQLDAGQAGLLAVVISASGSAAAQSQDLLAEAVAVQLAAVFQRPELGRPKWFKVITEKRATYACAPGVARPANDSGLPGLVIAGDYTAGDYPATLESAVRSGVAAAALLKGAAI